MTLFQGFSAVFCMPILNNSKHEKFAQLVANGTDSPAAAYCAVYKSHAKTAAANASKLVNTNAIARRIDELRALSAPTQKRFLTLDQKREFLALVVNTPADAVDERSPLCQQADFSESPSGTSRKLRMPDKLKALELDARLAGELRESHELEVVDRRATSAELQARLDAATPLLQAHLAKEAQ